MTADLPSERNHEREHGDHQSPINIDLSNCTFDPALKGMQFTNHPDDCVQVLNKGTTWSIGVRADAQTRLRGKHLPGIYRLAEVHAHWGTNSNNGSEHMINNNGYAAEIHMVHYNEAHSLLESATRHGDGLAVLGILLQEGPIDNPALDPLIEALKEVPYSGQITKLPQGWDLAKLLPGKYDDKDFCTYCGSLTTPPYTECVVWTVFVHPVPISSRQLKVFRSLSVNDENDPNAGSVKIVHNARHPHPLGKRTVAASFKY